MKTFLSGAALLASSCFVLVQACGQKAQVVIPVAPSGTVTGHVIVGDTQRPAKFTQVYLMRLPEAGELTKTAKDLEASPPPERIAMLDGRTGQDGSFTIPGVPVGEYYVVAVMPGYMFPGPHAAETEDDTDLQKLMAGVPVTRVTADKTSQAEVKLHRGGAVAGRVQFDDGAPVVAAFVQVRLAGKQQKEQESVGFMPLRQARGQASSSNLTDDEGHFRLTGLQPGKYLVSVTVNVAGGNRMVITSTGYTMGGSRSASPLIVYQPGTLRESEAKAIEVAAGEPAARADIEVNLSGMHSIRGTVLVKEDRHAPNRARVVVADDVDEAFTRSVPVDADGHWQLDYMPAGTYTATVSNAEDVDNPNPIGFNVKVVTFRTYGKAKEPVVVGDHDAVADEMLLEEAAVKTK